MYLPRRSLNTPYPKTPFLFSKISSFWQKVELAARPFVIMHKDEIEHLETASSKGSDNVVRTVLLSSSPSIDTMSQKHNEKAAQAHEDPITTLNSDFVEDKQRSKRLRRKVDLRFLPLCAFIYLLNYLDRGNIGAARIMNEETNDDILHVTNTTSQGYAIAVSMFSLAYALFEVPSNWIMKRYVRPSLWLSILLFGWGALTIGFTGVKTYGQIVGLRFLIGVFEAGFYPGYRMSGVYPISDLH